jgi:hypothetical protein
MKSGITKLLVLGFKGKVLINLPFTVGNQGASLAWSSDPFNNSQPCWLKTGTNHAWFAGRRASDFGCSNLSHRGA